MSKFTFWLKSSRGTDACSHVEIAGNPDAAEIKSRLERWANSFGAMHVSGNYVRYGWHKGFVDARDVSRRTGPIKAVKLV